MRLISLALVALLASLSTGVGVDARKTAHSAKRASSKAAAKHRRVHHAKAAHEFPWLPPHPATYAPDANWAPHAMYGAYPFDWNNGGGFSSGSFGPNAPPGFKKVVHTDVTYSPVHSTNVHYRPVPSAYRPAQHAAAAAAAATVPAAAAVPAAGAAGVPAAAHVPYPSPVPTRTTPEGMHMLAAAYPARFAPCLGKQHPCQHPHPYYATLDPRAALAADPLSQLHLRRPGVPPLAHPGVAPRERFVLSPLTNAQAGVPPRQDPTHSAYYNPLRLPESRATTVLENTIVHPVQHIVPPMTMYAHTIFNKVAGDAAGGEDDDAAADEETTA